MYSFSNVLVTGFYTIYAVSDINTHPEHTPDRRKEDAMMGLLSVNVQGSRGGSMRKTGLGGWQLSVAAAVVLAVYMPSSAGEWPTLLAGLGETSDSTLASTPGTDTEAGAYRLFARLDYPVSWRVAQAAPTPGTSESVEGKEGEPHQISANELSRQLSNPVTSLWSLEFQFNNYRLRTASGTTTSCSSRCCPLASRKI